MIQKRTSVTKTKNSNKSKVLREKVSVIMRRLNGCFSVVYQGSLILDQICWNYSEILHHSVVWKLSLLQKSMTLFSMRFAVAHYETASILLRGIKVIHSFIHLYSFN